MPWEFSTSVDLGGTGLAASTNFAICKRVGGYLFVHPTIRDVAGAFAEGNGLYGFDTGEVIPDDVAPGWYIATPGPGPSTPGPGCMSIGADGRVCCLHGA